MIRILLAAIALLIAALTIEEIRGGRARAAVLRSALARDSVEASHDTTREVHVASLHDSVRVFVRRVAQQEQRADQLDRALRARRVARVSAETHIAPLDTAVRTDTVFVSTDSVWHVPFSVRRAPYSVTGEIAHRASNKEFLGVRADVVSLKVDLDSIPLGVRLSCQAASGSQVARGVAAIVAPPWARVVLSDVEQEPTVCNPAVERASTRQRFRDFAHRAGLSVGVAAISESSGQIVIRPALLFGIRMWP